MLLDPPQGDPFLIGGMGGLTSSDSEANPFLFDKGGIGGLRPDRTLAVRAPPRSVRALAAAPFPPVFTFERVVFVAMMTVPSGGKQV
jgi:hypothetical protein